MLIILKAIFTLIGFVYGFSNICKVFKGQAVSSFQVWAMSIGIVGFITMHFWFGV